MRNMHQQPQRKLRLRRFGPRQPRFLQVEDGNAMVQVRKAIRLTQPRMAALLGCSVNTVRRCEYEGRLPRSRAVRNNLRVMAGEVGVGHVLAID